MYKECIQLYLFINPYAYIYKGRSIVFPFNYSIAEEEKKDAEWMCMSVISHHAVVLKHLLKKT